ncbi:GPI anchored serine-threonine rich family protein [Aspergillus thermomutatus]|uniref:Yeast cell wall synthesis Kre9/Knh1-like N-terminal domain-containing protein n=1 Tax=Aspergillus thermomutatus TaxID=41047 RepID=A0A397HNH4_ASPTH|nr:uncharacterized protein CDV56_107285 [Aspergillus thermomutatus]RHZ62010.1 hypothetical protein CDV56_107285 [Aspergillus thermomutatus]
MMRSVIPLIVSLGSLAAAINITSPAANSTYAAGSTVTVEWTSVDTDPTNFSLYLWNFVSWPPTYVPLAVDIPTSDLSYPVQIPCDTNPEWGYQISGINGTNVYIIYAQGDKFTVSEPVNGTACVDPAPLPTASTCPSAAASTVYVTVSPTGSSSRLFHHSSHVLPAPSPSTTSTSTSKYVKPGIVPKTIGWCSDYSHPVTLDKVPTPTPSVANNGNGNGSDASPVVTAAPGQVTGARGPRVKTITTTVSVAACPNVDAI